MSSPIVVNNQSDISMRFDELVDRSTFAQILSCDGNDDDDIDDADSDTEYNYIENDTKNHEFSRELYLQFLQQAEDTFKEMDKSLAKRDLEAFSRQAHFLKGSSAALGLIKVREACDDILHFSFGGTRKGKAATLLGRNSSDSSAPSSVASSSSSSSEEENEAPAVESPKDAERLIKCRQALDNATMYYREVVVLLQKFYRVC